MQRVADIIVAMLLLVFATPLMAFIALAIKLTSGSSVLVRQKIGDARGHEIDLLKFRTDGTIPNPIVWFLRHTRLEMVPQIFNVIRGDLTLFGTGRTHLMD
jgi:putative colanic acid biosynthesis UDP-glucose lipid carrier transferase